MTICSDKPTAYPFPNWVPDHVKTYLTHILMGVSIRELSRIKGCHASTILRQIRKVELRRDEPLIDQALGDLSNDYNTSETVTVNTYMAKPDPINEEEISRQARRVLRRLCENGAYLVVSPKMDVAAVFKNAVAAKPTRIAVVDYKFVRLFSLKEWIEGEQLGRIGR